MNRREFITTTTFAAGAMGMYGSSALAIPRRNPLPQWKGFNLLDFFPLIPRVPEDKLRKIT
jgi:endoglucanase